MVVAVAQALEGPVFDPRDEKESESRLGWVSTDWRSLVMASAVAAQALVIFSYTFSALPYVVSGGLGLGFYYVLRARELQSIQSAVRDLTRSIAKFDTKSSDHFEKLSQTELGFTDLLSELKKTVEVFFSVFQAQSAVSLWQETITALKEYQAAKTDLVTIQGKIASENETLSLLTARLEQAVAKLSQTVENDAQIREDIKELLIQLKAKEQPCEPIS